jgi:methionyl-tRNA formyltransferase
VPRLGCYNVHASLLPAYRGAAPIHWAIINCEERTGVTIMQMDEGMDTGDMLLQEAVEIAPDDTAGSLHDKLAPLGARMMLDALARVEDGTIEPMPQPEEGSSQAPMLSKDDGLVDFDRPAAAVDCHIRGMDPWPGAYTFLDNRRLKLFRSRVVAGYSGRPGEVLCVDRRGLLIACREGAVCVCELQLPGRRCLFATEVVAGCRIPVGTVLGPPPEVVA